MNVQGWTWVEYLVRFFSGDLSFFIPLYKIDKSVFVAFTISSLARSKARESNLFAISFSTAKQCEPCGQKLPILGFLRVFYCIHAVVLTHQKTKLRIFSQTYTETYPLVMYYCLSVNSQVNCITPRLTYRIVPNWLCSIAEPQIKVLSSLKNLHYLKLLINYVGRQKRFLITRIMPYVIPRMVYLWFWSTFVERCESIVDN